MSVRKMKQPICDYVKGYAASGMARFHMPGHKGVGDGAENTDITEIRGADSLYEASGIIAESEALASSLFGSFRTLYSTEGSSQCIKAMVHMAVTAGRGKRILSARNAHRAFIYACALTEAEVEWIYPAEENCPVCACPVTPRQVAQALSRGDFAAVYLTSPDYLGGMQDIGGIAAVCREKGVPLLVDNAHGAYLRFMPEDMHPLTLGADLCCDSAHKTLPALTGGAYLHIADEASAFGEKARQAMEVYGSTSPSYLILCSLDRTNAWLAGPGREKLNETALRLVRTRRELEAAGWHVLPSDPLRITVCAAQGADGFAIADRLRAAGAECEHADRDHMVCMLSPMNTPRELDLLPKALGKAPGPPEEIRLPPVRCRKGMSIRDAVFSAWENVPVRRAAGRICASPAAACPPAVPVVCAGEIIDEDVVSVMEYCGIAEVRAVKEPCGRDGTVKE